MDVAGRHRIALLPLLAVLVLASLLLPERQDDEEGYLELARNLADGGYATGRPDALLDADPAYPDLWFGPGLPLVLAPPVAAGVPVEALRFTGPVFIFLALLVFYSLLRRSTSERVALGATWALGLYLPVWSVLTHLHSEPLAVLCLVVGVYATVRALERPATRWVAAGGAAFAGLALTRVAYGWVLTAALAVALVAWASGRPGASRVAAVFALALALCVPWLAYTAAETGRPLQWGNSGALSLYWMSSPHEGDRGDWQRADAVFRDPALAPHRPTFERLRGLPLAEQNRELERAALANIRHHPLSYLSNVAANVSRMLFDHPYSRTPPRRTALFFALPNALLLAAVAAATVAGLRRGGPLATGAWVVVALGLAAFALHAALAAYPRMLLPIAPLAVWFAATTLDRRRRPAPHAAATACR